MTFKIKPVEVRFLKDLKKPKSRSIEYLMLSVNFNLLKVDNNKVEEKNTDTCRRCIKIKSKIKIACMHVMQVRACRSIALRACRCK